MELAHYVCISAFILGRHTGDKQMDRNEGGREKDA